MKTLIDGVLKPLAQGEKDYQSMGNHNNNSNTVVGGGSGLGGGVLLVCVCGAEAACGGIVLCYGVCVWG